MVLFLYSIFADRLTPYTSQATVQAFVVRMAPEVAGRVIEVNVTDNQRVKGGDVLFRIDPEPFELALQQAEAKLAGVGQSIGANTAAVSSAQERLIEAKAKRDNVREQASRILQLVEKGVYAKARADQATKEIEVAEAEVREAEAEVERARQELGPQGNDNPQFREALAAVEQAKLNLVRTTVLAPSDGVITNLQLTDGEFVAVGAGGANISSIPVTSGSTPTFARTVWRRSSRVIPWSLCSTLSPGAFLPPKCKASAGAYRKDRLIPTRGCRRSMS